MKAFDGFANHRVVVHERLVGGERRILPGRELHAGTNLGLRDQEIRRGLIDLGEKQADDERRQAAQTTCGQNPMPMSFESGDSSSQALICIMVHHGDLQPP